MPVWSAATLQRFLNDAEDEFVRDFPCIVARYSLDIVSGTSEYTLPDYVENIRRVTWRGKEITPITHRSFRNSVSNLTSEGEPREYIFNKVGKQKIKFFPIPDETIAADQTNLWGSNIGEIVIVEFYRTSDYSTITIPAFFRRRLAKAYVMAQSFSIESKGQNLKAAKYYQAKWEYLKQVYGDLLDDVFNRSRRLVIGGTKATSGYRLPRPQLPISAQGVDVDD